MSVTPNIADLAAGHNLAAKNIDPFLTFLPIFTSFVLSVQITYAMKEKMRLIMHLLDSIFYDVEKFSRKVKIVFLAFLLGCRLMLLIFIVEAAMIFILLASNTIELLNNVLSVLVLDQIDNMGALLLFNFLRTNYNDLTTQDNFMTIMSSNSIENFIGAPVWIITITVVV